MRGEAMTAADSQAVLDVLLARQSVPVPQLAAPGPGQAQIDAAFALALRAPDHGPLQPWRFRLIRGAARHELSDLLVRATLARDPAAPAPLVERTRSTPLNAPLSIAVGARLQEHPKVPEIEQIMAVGAAVMNLLNAFHAQGFGAIWLTGPNSFDPSVARALGFAAPLRHLGFVYIGTPQGKATLRERPGPAGYVSDWLRPEA
ncbi:MAG: nitroreductase [Gammaproteobacteria bacterium]|nr:nitroreductase [Gammaproteobacteria bacterium]